MEHNDAGDDSRDTENNVSPSNAKINARNKSRAANSKSNKTSKPSYNTKKKSLRAHWKSATPLKKLELIGLGLVAVGGIGYLVAYIVVSVRQNTQAILEHMPLIIASRPPQMPQPFTCNAQGLHTGNISTFIRNVGNARATKVFPYELKMKIIPDQKTGNAFVDDLPEANCTRQFNMGQAELNLAPGQEWESQIRQSTMGFFPPLPEGATVQFYLVTCAYYSDDHDIDHGTCDTYRLNFASTNPLDVLGGNPDFVCDGAPRTGKFVGTITGHCQQ